MLSRWWPLALVSLVWAGTLRADTQVAVGGFVDVPGQGTGRYLGPSLEDEGARRPQSLRRGVPPQARLWVQGSQVGLWDRFTAMRLRWDTDTLTGALQLHPGGGLSLGWVTRGRLLGVGTLTEHVVDGVNVYERGFASSYLSSAIRAAITVLGHLTAEVEIGGRGWWFNRWLWTDASLTLPRPFLAAEPRARLRWDNTRADEGVLGLRPGVLAQLELAADLRSVVRPFGELNGVMETRNALPDRAVPRWTRLMGHAGGHLGWLWLQVRGQAGWGVQQDDLSRQPLGGMSEDGVMMPGAASVEYLADRYAALHAQAGLHPRRYLFVGVSAHGVLFNDPRRAGATDELGLLRGLMAETRLGLFGFGALILRVGGNIDVKRPHGVGSGGVFMGWSTQWPGLR